jgi:transposase-like protein
MTKKKGYKRYSPEFKREALLRAAGEGVTDKGA